METLATVGFFSSHRNHVLTWEFCRGSEGEYFTFQEQTGKKFAVANIEELRDSYRMLTRERCYAPCCLLKN